jgi:hypothetical protein
MNISNLHSIRWVGALFCSILLAPCSVWGQEDKGTEKLTLVVTTNVPHSKLIRLDDGAVLATANNNGVIRWVPDEISKADCRLEVQALYHLSEPITLRRNLRKSVLFFNGIGASVLGGSVFGMTVESTESEALTSGQVLVGAAVGAAGCVLGACNPRNYSWKAGSRNVSVTLRHTPEYMDKLWEEVKSEQSIARIERFRHDYPEFERTEEIEKELSRLVYESILKDIAENAREALEKPEEQSVHRQDIQGHIQALTDWRDRFAQVIPDSNIAQKSNLEMVMKLLDASPKADASAWLSAVSALERDVALPFALAGFLSTWSTSESPRETLLQTLTWAEQTRYSLLTASVTREAISSFILRDWMKKVHWNEAQIDAAALKTHLGLWRETLARLESGLSLTDVPLASFFEERWANELSQWSRPKDLECVLAKQVMYAWIQLNEAEANTVLNAWRGLILPSEVKLGDVFKNCPSSAELVPAGKLVPLALLDVAGLRPDECNVHLKWSKELGDNFTASPEWVILPSKTESNATWTYALKDGREWRISTIQENPGKPGQLWNGTYSGVQPSYAMTNSDGEAIVIKGEKIIIPQTRYILDLKDNELSFSQEVLDGSATKSNYRGQCQIRTSSISAASLECSCESIGGESSSTVALNIDLVAGKAIFLGGTFGPEFVVTNPSPGGGDELRAAVCFWVYDATDKPQYLMLSEPYAAQSNPDDVEFFSPLALATSSKGLVYPASIDPILKDLEALANHPGLSKGQLSSGRSDRFGEVESEIASIQSELEVLLTYRDSEILPSNVSWSSLNQIPDELAKIVTTWEDLDRKLTRKEVRAYAGSYDHIDWSLSITYTILISEDGSWTSELFFEGMKEYEMGKLIGNKLYHENGDFLGKIEGRKLHTYFDGEPAFVLNKN